MKIISGAQTGADQAGLYAGRDSGFKTGGHIPKTWRTMNGPMPELGEMFGIEEHFKWGYPPRTKLNATNADCTLLLTVRRNSPGSKLTRKYAKEAGKPLMDIDLNAPINPFIVAKWIKDNGYQIINIAGNGDGEGKPNGDVFEATYEYLMKVFKEYKKL